MPKIRKTLLALLLGGLMLGGLTACDTIPITTYYGGYSYGYDDYYYYPSVRIYYHPYSGYYYYPYNNRWIKVRKLPPRYRLPYRDRVVIKHKHNRPWAYNNDHRKRYRKKHDRRIDDDSDRMERKRNRELYERRLRRMESVR